jgi:arylformamidase
MIDITRSINNKTKIYDGDPSLEIKEVFSVEKYGYSVNKITFGSHMGTHIDFPRHFYKNGKTSSDYTLEYMQGRAVLIEGNSKVIFEKEIFGEHDINAGDIVLIKNADKGITLEAAEYLVYNKIKMICTDSIDIEEYEDFCVHKKLLGNDILIIENAFLENVEEGEYNIYVFPLKIDNMEALPVRAVLTK